MSRQKDIHDFIETKLNNTGTGLPFELYYRYHIGDEDFTDKVLNSIDLGETDPNNVKVEWEDNIYNTQKGVFTLDNINYIPCIIEDFVVTYEPIALFLNALYSVPISFFVNERFNKDNGDIFTESIEKMQDALRGHVEVISGNKVMVTHSDVRPVSGLIEFNDLLYRVYTTTIDFEMISKGYFGEEMQFHIQNSEIFGGSTTRVFPIIRTSNRLNDLAPFQGFKTVANANLEIKNIDDMSGFGLSLSFLVESNDDLTDHFIKRKFVPPNDSEVYNVSVTYPNLTGTPFSDKYLIESITGGEGITDKLVVTVNFKKAV
jgi:hypothetical protein